MFGAQYCMNASKKGCLVLVEEYMQVGIIHHVPNFLSYH